MNTVKKERGDKGIDERKKQWRGNCFSMKEREEGRGRKWGKNG
jgi:hypothetical protein